MWKMAALAVLAGAIGCSKGPTVAIDPPQKEPVTTAPPKTKKEDETPVSLAIGSKEVTAEILGLPFYPGSSPDERGTAHSIAKGDESYISTRSTTDDPSQVMAFYKPKFKDPSSFSGTSGTDRMASMSETRSNGDMVSVVARKPEKGPTAVVITLKKAPRS